MGREFCGTTANLALWAGTTVEKPPAAGLAQGVRTEVEPPPRRAPPPCSKQVCTGEDGSDTGELGGFTLRTWR